MDEKASMEELKDRAAGVEVHDWPFDEDTDKAFYVETEDHRRFAWTR